MEHLNPLVTVIAIIFFIALIFIMAWIVVEIGKRNAAGAKQYEADYKLIKLLLNKNEVTALNFEKLTLRLSNLKRLAFKNKDKTEKLESEFYKKYGKIRIEKHLQK